MANSIIKKGLLALFLIGLIYSCNNPVNRSGNKIERKPNDSALANQIPLFDTEYSFDLIKKQVEFGPRIPESKAHLQASQFLYDELKKYCQDVKWDNHEVKIYNGKTIPCKNIIATFNPAAKTKVILSGHYDTRPFADQEDDEKHQKDTFQGANDGASSAALLISIAKNLSLKSPSIGVILILFDVEDYGAPVFSDNRDPHTYCLGTQAWAEKLDKSKYVADCAVNFDMIGGLNPKFYQEGVSKTYATNILDKFWNAASKAGYGSYFLFQNIDAITDDHYYINAVAGIPAIDVVDMDKSRPKSFPLTWHTKADNLNNIHKESLKAVGQSALQFIYTY